ncbi:MAG TPA: hypothetical protein PLJ21_07790 [Pseudobdellovibrionaceae bacterium]|nr:hypothetical protein [Pseudobdellovibrionaceae bacterium]
MKMNHILTFGFYILSISACSTDPKKNDSTNSPINYNQLIEQNSNSTISYDGLQNAVDAKATFISTPVAEAQKNIQSNLYSWTDEKKTSEIEKENKLLETESRFFVSIYTPEKKYDDLDKNKTLWRVFLEIDGKQWDAKVKKIKLLEAEIKSLYPYYTTFTTAYEVSFPIPTKSLSLHPFSLNITGPIAKINLKFPKPE